MDLLVLVFAHLLADYPLQGDFLARMKGQNVLLLLTHAAIWTGIVGVAGYLIGLNITIYSVLFLFIVHAVVDYIKAKPLWFQKKLNPLGLGLIIDQFIHLLQLLLLLFIA